MNLYRKAFTLIELLIVIAIIGILAGILIVSMTSATNSANDVRRKADINQLVKAITIIKTTDGVLPIETNANCKLGSTNSSENCSGIEAKLTTQGIAIPKDPVSGNYYTYNRVSADDFTLSANMSDNSNYSYSSASSKYSSSSLLTGWTKRKPITITNTSGSTLTDYQISLDIAYDSDMQADFDDIRFTDSNASLLLSYWIESKTDSSTAKVWVKIPSIPTSGTTVYLYYGNSSAVSTANGDNTFEFFDDFSGSSLDATKWTSSGSGITVSSGNLNISSDGKTYSSTNSSIATKNIFDTSSALRTRIQTRTYNTYLSFVSGSSLGLVYFNNYESAIGPYGVGRVGSAASTDGDIIPDPPTGFYIEDFISIDGQKLQERRNDGTWNISTRYNGHTTSQSFELIHYRGYNALSMDWILLRNAILPELSYLFGVETSN